MTAMVGVMMMMMTPMVTDGDEEKDGHGCSSKFMAHRFYMCVCVNR